MNDEKKRLRAAHHMLRLCFAVQTMTAKLGPRATVKDVLKCAGMSRRSFYEYFTGPGLENAWARMNAAWADSNGTWRPPHAWWMAYAFDPTATFAAGICQPAPTANEAFEAAQRAKAMHDDVTLDDAPDDGPLLFWFSLMNRQARRPYV